MTVRKILILGGGTGGTMVANLLARHLKPGEAELTVLDHTARHVYQPSFLYVPFGMKEVRNNERPECGLLDKRVKLVQDKAVRIDPRGKVVETQRCGPLNYDFLVVATGSHLDPGAVPGFEGAAHHFYTPEAAEALRGALEQFSGGEVVIGVAGVPYKCPPAPLEFTFMIDRYLKDRGLRDRSKIHYVSPLPRCFPIESASRLLTTELEKRGVEIHIFFNVDSVNPQTREVNSVEGETLKYDLLVLIPPHKGAQVIIDSGLGETAAGWLPTDRQTLKVQGHEGIYAIGDATNLPVSKSGAAAHFEADVVVENLLAELRGEAVTHRYNGKVMCFVETGGLAATRLLFDYTHPPLPPQPNLYYHLQKALFNRFYFSLIPPARLPGGMGVEKVPATVAEKRV